MEKYKAKVSTGPLNVRQGPSPKSQAIRIIGIGTGVTVSDEKEGFAEIGTDEWVNINFIVKCKVAQSDKPKQKKSEVEK